MYFLSDMNITYGNQHEALKGKIDRILTQISQCLRSDGGRFISISFQQPHFRRPFSSKRANINGQL